MYEATICMRPMIAMRRLITEYQTLCTPLPVEGVVQEVHGMWRRFVIWAPAAHEIVGVEMVTFVGCFAFAWIGVYKIGKRWFCGERHVGESEDGLEGVTWVRGLIYQRWVAEKVKFCSGHDGEIPTGNCGPWATEIDNLLVAVGELEMTTRGVLRCSVGEGKKEN